jgi:hypothetical protein
MVESEPVASGVRLPKFNREIPDCHPLWTDGRAQHLGSARQFETLHQCLTQGRKPDIDGEVGIERLLIAFAAEQSIQQGGKIVDAPKSDYVPDDTHA